jgi:predicted Zn finger-like uncharacterized protein
MLTQCPECKTTFRLNVTQLKAAGGKVRCSRCHTVFDALDNLFAPPPVAEQPAVLTPEPPREEKAAPAAESVTSHVTPLDSAPGAEPQPAADTAVTTTVEEKPSHTGVEAQVTTPPAEEDTLSAFIEELEESTAGSNEPLLPLVRPSTASANAARALQEEHTEIANGRSSPHSDLITTALDTIDDGFTSIDALQEGGELKDTPAEDFDEIFNIEPVAAEPEEPDDASIDAFEEFLNIEPEATEPEEPEEPDDDAADTFEEILSVEPVASELEEPDDISVDAFEEFLSIEPEATELEEPDDDAADTFEEMLNVEAPDEPVVSDEELDAFFDEVDTEDGANAAEAETLFDTVPTAESEDLAPLSESDLDTFFAEPATESRSEAPLAAIAQEEPLESFEDQANDVLLPEPDDESALETITLHDESLEIPETPVPAPRPDPLEPFSEEQLESMLSPTEEQVTEEAAAKKVSLYAPEELDLDTGDVPTEELTVDEEPQSPVESPPLLTDYTIPTDYVIPAELTATKSGSGAASIVWALGILLMCGTLVLQYLYYHRLQLVENPQLRPLLTTLCELTDCELPPRRDLGRIELTEHLMQFHPNYEQSLLINATLANRADFDQPYPLVEIVMTDIEQQVVAQRRFTPEQYLHNYRRGDSFRANSEVPLQLEVLDPGNDAVGFEFRFY